MDFLDEFLAKVAKAPKRGRPKKKRAPIPKAPPIPQYVERADGLLLRTQVTHCRGCASEHRHPLGTYIRYRQYTRISGRLRTEPTNERERGTLTTFRRTTPHNAPSNLPILPMEEVHEDVDACEHCFTHTYIHKQVALPLFSHEEERELAAYAYLNNVPQPEHEKNLEALNSYVDAMNKDMARLEVEVPAYSTLPLKDRIEIAAYHPDLLLPADWLETELEALRCREFDEWLDERQRAPDFTPDGD